MAENGYEIVNYQKILRIETESGREEVYYPLIYEDLPEEYRIFAEQSLGETADMKENGLRRLREFMERENHSATDDILITVLRACKYNLEKSESKLERFLKLRRRIIQQVCEIPPDELESILDVVCFGVLPYRDKHGRTIFITEPPKCLDKYPLEIIERVGYALVLYTMEFPLSTVCGLSYLCENKDHSVSSLYPVLKAFRRYISSLKDLPIRYGRVDACNEHVLCRIFYNSVRGFLPKKMSERVHFHGNSVKSLHSVYHPNILPSEYGGNMGPKHDKFYRAGLINFINKLREENSKERFQI